MDEKNDLETLYDEALEAVDAYKIDLVDKWYRMNPETDTVLFDGEHLTHGMRVLIQDAGCREDISNFENLTKRQKNKALVENRWCMISNVRFRTDKSGYRWVDFLATYDDGYEYKRSYVVDHAWIVKRDSLEKVDKTRNHIENVIRRAALWNYGIKPEEANNKGEFEQAISKAMNDIFHDIL